MWLLWDLLKIIVSSRHFFFQQHFFISALGCDNWLSTAQREELSVGMLLESGHVMMPLLHLLLEGPKVWHFSVTLAQRAEIVQAKDRGGLLRVVWIVSACTVGSLGICLLNPGYTGFRLLGYIWWSWVVSKDSSSIEMAQSVSRNRLRRCNCNNND